MITIKCKSKNKRFIKTMLKKIEFFLVMEHIWIAQSTNKNSS